MQSPIRVVQSVVRSQPPPVQISMLRDNKLRAEAEVSALDELLKHVRAILAANRHHLIRHPALERLLSDLSEN